MGEGQMTAGRRWAGKPISFPPAHQGCYPVTPGHTPGMLRYEGIYRLFQLLIYVSQSSNERAATVNLCLQNHTGSQMLA